MKLVETESNFSEKKKEFEKLRSDVQIKLKFLDENRVGSLDHSIPFHVYHPKTSSYLGNVKSCCFYVQHCKSSKYDNFIVTKWKTKTHGKVVWKIKRKSGKTYSY